LLVDFGLTVVLGLVYLVREGILGSGGSGGEGSVGVLGDFLVTFLGGSGTSLLDGLGDVVTREGER
jgi:hypothetical protein